MLLDLHGHDGAVFNTFYDVCVSGSGPAGMSLALKLAEKRRRVLLLEAGGLSYSEESNRVYAGSNNGLDYFSCRVGRQRFFGGTSNHWGGMCHALSAGDFERREHVPHSGWPIRKTDLDPYFAAATDILDVKTPRVPDYLELNGESPDLKKIDFGYSSPITRFGKKYRRSIESSASITCVLNANVVDIDLVENARAVSALRVSDYKGRSFEARGHCYVLCHGGIENARTLLNANSRLSAGIGNGRGLVGRFFMEHPTFTVASALLNHEHPAFSRFAGASQAELGTAFYAPTRRFQERERTLNFGLRFSPHEGIGSRPRLSSFKARLKRFICMSDTLLPVADRLSEKDRIGCASDLRLKTAGEQLPNPASRIRLGEDVDRFGNRRVEVGWALTELDKHTLKSSALAVGKIMARKNLGRVRLADWLLDPALSFPDTLHDEVAGNHHMGTTRMATSAEHGVVDANLKVFGIDNLYIGGSSTFPTSGHVNPTFTIVQLSLRLADHIDAVLHSTA